MELIILLGIGLLMWWALRARRSTQKTAPPGATPSPRLQHVQERIPPSAQSRPGDRLPFASPGMAGPLFSYGGLTEGMTIDGPYAIIDVETTGLSPNRGDRVIEIAVARVDANGRIEDEYATLINPDGRDTGPVFVHGISNDAVRDAPLFRDVAGDVLSRCQDAVVVAHNATFEERFLAAEFHRAGVLAPTMPALCTLWLGQRTFRTPNHKLHTLATEAGWKMVDAHAALGDVRAIAHLLPRMLERHGGPLMYSCQHAEFPALTVGRVRPKTRAVALRRGTDGWMVSIMARLPITTADASDPESTAYLEALSIALEDGKIVGDEARALAKLVGAAGLGSAQVATLNERFLESMREAAFQDDILTTDELRQLRNAAKLLGTSDYFDDLQPTGATDQSVTRSSFASTTAPTATRVRRCGHCRHSGHYRPSCPQLEV